MILYLVIANFTLKITTLAGFQILQTPPPPPSKVAMKKQTYHSHAAIGIQIKRNSILPIANRELEKVHKDIYSSIINVSHKMELQLKLLSIIPQLLLQNTSKPK